MSEQEKRAFLGKEGVEVWTKNQNKVFFLTVLATAIKDPTTSRRKHANELNVNEKTCEGSNQTKFKPKPYPSPLVTLYMAF